MLRIVRFSIRRDKKEDCSFFPRVLFLECFRKLLRRNLRYLLDENLIQSFCHQFSYLRVTDATFAFSGNIPFIILLLIDLREVQLSNLQLM